VILQSKDPDVSCLKTTPKTVIQSTQQACSRKRAIDSHCMESLLEHSRAERRHLVKYDLIVSRQVANAKPAKDNQKNNQFSVLVE
jgi:hypothetical protein